MIPSIMELMPGVLKTLADGELHGKKEIIEATAAEFGVTDSEMKEKLKYGASKYKNRVGWALINLKNKELIRKSGTEYCLTDKGKKAAKDSPAKLTAKYVRSLSSSDNGGESDDDQNGKPENGEPVTVEEPVAGESGRAAETVNLTEGTEEKPVQTDDCTVLNPNSYAGIDPECEFMLVIRAKTGDVAAAKKLWGKYKDILVPMFRHCKNLTTEDERVSEAALVFARKLELFKPEKVRKQPKDWTFSYMLVGGAKNEVDKIIKHSIKEGRSNLLAKNTRKSKAAKLAAEKDIQKKEAMEASVNYGLNVSVSNLDNSEILVPTKLIELNPSEFNEKYSPEAYVMREMDVSLDERENELMNQLSLLQITILQLRRAGKTVQEIAEEMGCGFTKVRLNIVKAREIASSVFGVNYC